MTLPELSKKFDGWQGDSITDAEIKEAILRFFYPQGRAFSPQERRDVLNIIKWAAIEMYAKELTK